MKYRPPPWFGLGGECLTPDRAAGDGDLAGRFMAVQDKLVRWVGPGREVWLRQMRAAAGSRTRRRSKVLLRGLMQQTNDGVLTDDRSSN
jgi:hypothetical protein